MLARQPRDRYQTASELIVDLERSRLATPVPSFADPDLAKQDPWVQKCLESSAEPTRADPEMPARAVPRRADPGATWLLHFRNPAGQEVTRTATTQQIARLLREGRLPVGTEARRPDQQKFQPLNRFAEFRSIRPRPQPKRPPVPAPAGKDGVARVHETNGKAPSSPQRRALWLGLAGGVILLAAAVAALFKFVF
jgi:hypothetical protein